MAVLDGMYMQMDETISNFNIVKEVIIDTLYKDGVITAEQKEKYGTYYNILLTKDDWFRRVLAKLKKEKDSAWKIVYTRTHDEIIEDKKDENEEDSVQPSSDSCGFDKY